jgi:PBSX family phage terminase large subunit
MSLTKLSDKQIASFQDSTARINIFEGPVRAGKSYIALLRWLDFVRTGPKGPLIICGRTDKTIKRNIITPLQDLVGDAVQYYIGKGEVSLYGRTMYVIGANDDRAEAKIRGSEFAGALLDEVSLLPENFFKMLLSRLSIPNAKLFCSTNPDSPYHWFKRDFIDRENELDLKVFSYNIRDNPTLSEKYIADLSAEYKGLWYKRYILGEWCLADGAVYDFFEDEIHIMQMPTSEATYYIVGIDYGTTNPCVFTLIGYNAGAYPNMWLEKEYYYDSKATLRQKSDYDYSLDLVKFISGYNVKRIYIDPSAASFKQELRRNGISNVTDAENEVLPGIRFVGQLLTNGTFKVCSNCVETIKEFGNYLWDSKASERGEDKPIKKFDHCFMAGTMITQYFDDNPIEEIRKGDMVRTRSGYKKVIDIFENERECSEFILYNQIIRCTPDHKFFTLNRGWIEIKDLIQSDILITDLEELPWKTSSNLMESNIDVIQKLKTTVIKNITEHIKLIHCEDMDISIEMFGNHIMETYPKESIYITSTEIQSTMTLVISNVYQLLNIYPNMLTIFQKIKEKLEENTAKVLDLLQKNGIVQKKEESGTKSMLKTLLLLNQKENLSANNAQLNMLQKNNQTQDFVAINAKVNGEEKITLMMSLEYVNFVISNLQQINIQKPLVVQSLVEEKCIGKQKVYNLHVEEEHEYFANGFLVKNCLDSIRYSLFTHFFNMDLRQEFTEQDANYLESLYYKKYN